MLSQIAFDELQGIQVNTFKGVGVSVRGSSHFARDIPCQDACAFGPIDNVFTVFCIADGAGSASDSHISAHLITQLCIRECRNVLTIERTIPKNVAEWKHFMNTLFMRLTEAIDLLVHHQENFLTYKDFRSTLSVAIVHPKYIVASQVGDGAIVIQTLNDKLITLCKPKNGEYASDSYFLEHHGSAYPHQHTACYKGEIVGVALLTDGLTRLALHRTKSSYIPAKGFFLPFFETVRESNDLPSVQSDLYSYLHSERICQRTSDDKTLVLGVFKKRSSLNSSEMEQRQKSISNATSPPETPTRIKQLSAKTTDRNVSETDIQSHVKYISPESRPSVCQLIISRLKKTLLNKE